MSERDEQSLFPIPLAATLTGHRSLTHEGWRGETKSTDLSHMRGGGGRLGTQILHTEGMEG